MGKFRIAAPTTAKAWAKLTCLLVFVVWAGVEIADPLPNSSVFRYLLTHHRVHVLIEAEVDGEAVRLERTFRCYKTYSLNFDFMVPGFVQMRVRQAGAAIGASLKDGRYLHVVFPTMCSYAGDHSGEGYEQVGIPIFRVADRLTDPSRIEMHVDPDAVLSGRTGVKLLSIKVENPAPPEAPPVQDWEEADNLALSKQFVHKLFSADYAIIKEGDWWKEHEEVLPIFSNFSVFTAVGNIPEVRTLISGLWTNYPNQEGWLTSLDRKWTSLTEFHGTTRAINQHLADVHPVRIRDDIRVVDIQTRGVIEFAPISTSHNFFSNSYYLTDYLPVQILDSIIQYRGDAGFYVFYEPRSARLVILNSSGIPTNLGGQ